MRIRFHYIAPAWEWWWQVDDVFVSSGPAACTPPADGGYVHGSVSDENTGRPLNGAAVDDSWGHRAITVATPEDPVRPDGFYLLYLPSSGMQDLTASTLVSPGYGTDQQPVAVPVLGNVAQDFSLPAGLLTSLPAQVEVSVPPDDTQSQSLYLPNNGNLGAAFRIVEIEGPLPLVPNGPFADSTRHMSPKHLDDPDASGARYDYPDPGVPVLAMAGDIVQAWPAGLAFPWGIGFDKGLGRLWVGNPLAGGGDDRDYEFAANGAATGRVIDVAKIPQAFMADFAYDMINHTLWQVNVGGDNCIHELDPATETGYR